MTRLIQELTENLDLSVVDAQRAAFAVLAVHEGWPRVRIGRWLGISRARVGQRVTKYEKYAQETEKFPLMAKALQEAKEVDKDHDNPSWIAFTPEVWEDPNFVVEALRSVS